MCLAVPGKIISIHDEDSLMRRGQVRFGGIIKEVNLAYVPLAQVNEYVIVHVGFAISVLNEEEAQKIFSYLQEIQDVDEAGQ
ncbi:MAG: HypC/HybG/HupF family hydrogenase formation chaperone [Nitrospina sp.]|jgi:hydrogenase expression/formation protein HypC|nr:HypC/HybG/HupF family hydrogenase formation chaperone [Nitrospina sp.]MBT5633100.1 HypC/HybG/HupF family hydrogenase formation chaperone [Nitrospina sp.]